MNVRLNGKLENLDQEMTVKDCVRVYSRENPRVVVEINREIIAKAEWPSRKIKDGDTIEMIGFVGGG